MGAHLNGIQEVAGSFPVGSTNFLPDCQVLSQKNLTVVAPMISVPNVGMWSGGLVA